MILLTESWSQYAMNHILAIIIIGLIVLDSWPRPKCKCRCHYE